MPLHPFLKANVCYISDTEASPEEADEYTLEERTAKRRRIEVIAQSYLRGQPIYIQTAQLKGPFDNGWTNPWLSGNKEEKSRTGKAADISRKAVRKKAAKTKNSDAIKGKAGRRGLEKRADPNPDSKTKCQSSKSNRGKGKQKVKVSQPVEPSNPIEEIAVEKSAPVQTIGKAPRLPGVSAIPPVTMKINTPQTENRNLSGFTAINMPRLIPQELENAVSPIKTNGKTKTTRKKRKSGDNAVPSHLRPPLAIKRPSVNAQNEFSPGFPFRKVTKPNKASKKITSQLEKKIDVPPDCTNTTIVSPARTVQPEASPMLVNTPLRFMVIPAPVFTPINLSASTTNTPTTNGCESTKKVSQGKNKKKRRRRSKEETQSSQDNQGSIMQILSGFREENIEANALTPSDHSKCQTLPVDTTSTTIAKALGNMSTKLVEFETRFNTGNTPQRTDREGNTISDMDTATTPPAQLAIRTSAVSTQHSQLTSHPALAELEVQTTEEDSTLISFGPSPSKRGGPNLCTQAVLDFAQDAFFNEPSTPAHHRTNGCDILTNALQQAQPNENNDEGKDGDKDELDLDSIITKDVVEKHYITPFRDFKKSLGTADEPTSTINFNKHTHLASAVPLPPVDTQELFQNFSPFGLVTSKLEWLVQE